MNKPPCFTKCICDPTKPEHCTPARAKEYPIMNCAKCDWYYGNAKDIEEET